MEALIIKHGAMGDVLRTTPILYPLKQMGYKVSWLTSSECVPLVPRDHCRVMTTWTPGFEGYSLILSLDEEPEYAEKAHYCSQKADIIGVLNESGKINYTDSSKEWYDMSLLAKDKKRADKLKAENRSSYQEILFRMIGKKFNGENYILNSDMLASAYVGDIGIETRAGGRWKSKRWNGYEELARRILNIGLHTFKFIDRPTLQEYSMEIGTCRAVVTGDTLAMHLAIAHKIPTVAIFTCTSPSEIDSYNGRVEKVVSPKLFKAFYKKQYIKEAVHAVSLEKVYDALIRKIV